MNSKNKKNRARRQEAKYRRNLLALANRAHKVGLYVNVEIRVPYSAVNNLQVPPADYYHPANRTGQYFLRQSRTNIVIKRGTFIEISVIIDHYWKLKAFL